VNVNETRIENDGRSIDWWRHFRYQTSPSGRNRHSAIIDHLKNGCSVQMVHARQVVCIEH
jgi:hypothetical protein